MKKAILILICALVLISACGCVKVYPAGDPDMPPEDEAAVPDEEDTFEPPDLKPVKTEDPMPDVEPVDPDVPLPEPPPPSNTPSGMSPDPVNTMTFYPSYAHMVSYDPARGWAEFDYFDMLTGQDAIDWMVAHEGYTVADATDIVNDWGDGEFWEKNVNPGLRTIDLKEVNIELMYEPDGTQSVDATSIPSTVADVFALYHLDPDLLLDSFFYYIHVDGSGNVTMVQQVYWC